MSLAYKRITAEQDKMRNVFEKGEYPFSVKSCEQKPTKSGQNQMLVVELSVMNDEGRSITVTDWIMLDMENFEFKLRHFAATTGLLDSYDADTLDARDFLGKHGVAKLSIAEYEKDGEIIKCNRVGDYVKPGCAKGNQVKTENDTSFFDDDIPNM